MAQELPGVSGLGWNAWRPVNLDPACLEVENLVPEYPDLVCLETVRVWYPQKFLGHPEVPHRVSSGVSGWLFVSNSSSVSSPIADGEMQGNKRSTCTT